MIRIFKKNKLTTRRPLVLSNISGNQSICKKNIAISGLHVKHGNFRNYSVIALHNIEHCKMCYET